MGSRCEFIWVFYSSWSIEVKFWVPQWTSNRKTQKLLLSNDYVLVYSWPLHFDLCDLVFGCNSLTIAKWSRITVLTNQRFSPKFWTNLCHQYGIFGAESQTSLPRNVHRGEKTQSCIHSLLGDNDPHGMVYSYMWHWMFPINTAKWERQSLGVMATARLSLIKF